MYESRSQNLVARWLLVGVIMIIVQILLGGITRLTGSGLSITEWKPIMGSIPPLNPQQWQEAFEQYQQIAQYKFLNSHFELSDFKFIYFWEWFHRLWARLIGVVFGLGFFYFLIKGYFDRKMIIPLLSLFILGVLQGGIGWIMVASGLNDTDVYVNHIKLALHFMAALLLLCATLWFALRLMVPEKDRTPHSRAFGLTLLIVSILAIQLTYGAFMAGLRAALAAPTWPGINGMLIPEGLWDQHFVHHRINVHFVHRSLAFLLILATGAWYFRLRSWLKRSDPQSPVLRILPWPLLGLLLQAGLGILTVLSAPTIELGKFGLFEWMAELHQMVAMLILIGFFLVLYYLGKRSPYTS